MQKNILVLDTGKEWGGGTNSLLELLKRINKNKYHFTVLFYNNYKKGCESDIKTEIAKLGMEFLLLEQKKQPITVKIAKEFSRLAFFFSRRLKKYAVFFIDYHFRTKQNAEKISELLKNLKIDLFYMNNQPSSNLEGIIASKITGIPALQHSRIETTLNSFEVKAVNLWLKKMICVSEGVKNSFIRQGVEKSKCVVVYNGIDSKTIPQASRKEIRTAWGISDNEIVIGTVGSLIKRKQIKGLVESIAVIAGISEQPMKCMIVGKGPEKDNLVEMVKRKNLDGSVIKNSIPSFAISYINAMDILVMASEKEGLPRVILEAMLMGKPVIACDIAGPSELIVDGETGFLVSVGKADATASAILRLIENPALRKQMGEKGRKRVIENFSIEKYVDGTENVFAEVLGY
ncbi:MAG: glycosyltransferase [Deltaproteobacteria bacterium]|nr:glycosyltransferase [Deltaproteobacteria bacterium]